MIKRNMLHRYWWKHKYWMWNILCFCSLNSNRLYLVSHRKQIIGKPQNKMLQQTKCIWKWSETRSGKLWLELCSPSAGYRIIDTLLCPFSLLKNRLAFSATHYKLNGFDSSKIASRWWQTFIRNFRSRIFLPTIFVFFFFWKHIWRQDRQSSIDSIQHRRQIRHVFQRHIVCIEIFFARCFCRHVFALNQIDLRSNPLCGVPVGWVDFSHGHRQSHRHNMS